MASSSLKAEDVVLVLFVFKKDNVELREQGLRVTYIYDNTLSEQEIHKYLLLRYGYQVEILHIAR